MLKGLTTFTLIVLSLNSYAISKSICGANDDRVLSHEPTIGRLSIENKYQGCTVTLIGNRCALTAGHCKQVLVKAEFNTPDSYDSKPVPSAKEDVYYVDQNSIEYQDDGPGKDWSVFKFLPNRITGKFPGVVQGYKSVSFDKLHKDVDVRITGYGYDPDDFYGNFAQQTHTGKIIFNGGIFLERSVLKHTVDTMGGNSGSTIILEDTQEIIGIHTHGGCMRRDGANEGTIINKHRALKNAIKSCLADD